MVLFIIQFIFIDINIDINVLLSAFKMYAGIFANSVAMVSDSVHSMSDAWHHRSDALSSIGSFVGIIGVRFGFVFMDAVGKMTDKSCDEPILLEMKSIILEQEGVMGVDQIKT